MLRRKHAVVSVPGYENALVASFHREEDLRDMLNANGMTPYFKVLWSRTEGHGTPWQQAEYHDVASAVVS